MWRLFDGVRANFLQSGENILEHGNIIKKRKMTRKARVMFLTDQPRIFYVDGKKGEYKGEVPWDYGERMKVDVRSDVLWKIVTVRLKVK